MKYYNSSNHYKDACEAGLKEYAASYRTLLLLEKMRISRSAFLNLSTSDFVIIGAGDLCDIFFGLCLDAKITVRAVLEKNLDKYRFVKYSNLLRPIDLFDFYGNKNVLYIISYMDKYNALADLLMSYGISQNMIISMEEYIACLLSSGD